MAVYAVDTNKIFAISKDQLAKAKCKPSSDWKKLEHLCNTHNVELIKNPVTGTFDIKLSEKK